MRGRSYSPSPPRRGYGRRRRSPSPRGRYGGHDRDAPSSLLVRNLRHDCRPEDLRRPFSQFGPVKDIYLPRDYYTREPRGFGFVQYVDPADVADAKYRMDGQIFQGRELTVVFAEENRKKPTEMRSRDRTRGRHYDRRHSPARSPRYAHLPPPRYARSRSRSHNHYSPSPKRRQDSRSVSPKGGKHSQERAYSRENEGRSHSHSPPSYGNSKSRSRSRSQSRSQSHQRDQSKSQSPYPEEQSRDRTPSQ